MIKAIILDFDGIVLETNYIKLYAFVHLFRDYPKEVQEKVKKVHIDHGGLSRFKKFEMIYGDVLKQKLTKEESERLGQEFSEYVVKEILRAPFVDGMEQFLEEAYKRYDIFVISGTPEEEMRQIVRDRDFVRYFKDVYGSPRTKPELCRLILKENKYQKDEVIFVGDALSDWEGAVQNGVKFIARVTNYNEHLFRDKDVIRVRDFINFETVINN